MFAANVERPLPKLKILLGIIGSTLEKNALIENQNVQRMRKGLLQQFCLNSAHENSHWREML